MLSELPELQESARDLDLVFGMPRWAWTWALGLGVVLVAKLALASGRDRVTLAWWLWPGMDPDRFHAWPPTPVTTSEVVTTIVETVLGAALVWGVVPRLTDRDLAAWVGLIGLGLVLHFGVARLLSIHWRRRGYEARPLFDRPLASRSLGEFWGRRWNVGFRDAAERWIHRPLRRRLGPRGATAAVFAASGVGHDALLSLPAGGGYGRCTLYFAIQLVGVLGGHRLRSRIVTLAFVLLPLPLLFHGPFRDRVVLPFLAAIGASTC